MVTGEWHIMWDLVYLEQGDSRHYFRPEQIESVSVYNQNNGTCTVYVYINRRPLEVTLSEADTEEFIRLVVAK